MPSRSAAAHSLPASAVRALQAFADDLKLARKRRGESLRAWAARMDVSVPTLIRMEKGDPSVGIGVYVTALFLIGRHAAMVELAGAAQDTAALAADVKRARDSHQRTQTPTQPRKQIRAKGTADAGNGRLD